VLVVEDRFLLGSEIVRMLGELGCSAAGPAPTVAAGLRLLKAARGDLDLAVLDVDLRRESVFPLARALRARRIPIAFVTGYAAEALPREWLSSARVEKPFGARELAAALRAARSRRRRPRPARPSGIPALDPAAEALKEGRNLMMVVRAWLREHDQNSGALDVRGRGRRRRLRNMQRNQQSGPQADPPKVADRLSRVLSDDELVDQASQESFPASDAPSWTSGTDRNVETRVPRRDGQRPPPTSMNDPVV